MRQAPQKQELFLPEEIVFAKRVPLRLRLRAALRGRLLTFLVMLAVFAVIAISTGAYRSTRGLITIAIAFIIVSIASTAVFWLIGQFEPAIAPLTVSKRDGRGKPVTAREMKLKELELNTGEQIALAMSYSRSPPMLNRAWARIAIVAVMVAAWLTWTNYGPGLVGRNASLWGGLAMMILVTLLVTRVRRRASLAKMSEALLAAGRCAACGYDLKYLRPESDGCTVCAECGAAWRIGVWGDDDVDQQVINKNTK